MKAEELRIGNLVYWDVPEKQNVPHGVVGIFQNRLQTQPISLGNSMEEYLPIHLSPEWLERLGFEQYNEGFWRIGNSEGWFLTSDGELAKSLSEFYIRCESVHQLQNLIYSLTGKELELKQ